MPPSRSARLSSPEDPTIISRNNGATPSSSMPPTESLNAENVRRAYTPSRTQTAYRSYRRCIVAWIHAVKTDSARYFDSNGEIDVNVCTPKDFETFLPAKMSDTEKALKATTLSGYRSAIKDIFRQKKLPLAVAYIDDMTTFFAGLKRIEAACNQGGAGTGDLSTRRKRQIYSEWRIMMQHISAAIKLETRAQPPTYLYDCTASSDVVYYWGERSAD